MERKVVLITGCSSGIGLHLAWRLAADPSGSFKVYATLRDLRAQGPLWEGARVRGCPPGSLETLQLDVTDPSSVASARDHVSEGRVDVLVCNAGRGLLGPLEAHEMEAVGSVLDVNVVGTVRMLQAFLPDMKRRGTGRVLVTGSVGGLMGLPFNAVYCASKFALEGLCESLAVLLLPFGVHISLIECGPVRTAFQEKLEGGPGGVLGSADLDTRALFSRYQRHCERVFREVAQDPEDVVEVFVQALCAPRPVLRYFSTEHFLPLAGLRFSDPGGSQYVEAMHHAVFTELEEGEAQSGSFHPEASPQ
ncbi:17-beta-hydroxysteroid dehydrogenase type 1 [Monodelphis domestica]|uniref:17-beta-hydroxysteroid dehydrogenase type 1 n=1 Tax=Monodelphis domestica TaxID=13616 RepID=UPI0024E1CAD9|nr:17-beta-hydroxysteroid dehydrogenase type 1 [Monodelphis domestica]XP_056672706.1 17-beta-hydroxysteroid dehydrogenase type 1 [Monodelphis domestica]